MFKENKRLSATTDTLIGQGTLGEGTLLCEANLRIEGEYRGDIDCKGDVIVGEIGVARSNITASEITIAGKVFGDIVTKGRLVITATGHLTGNITAATLIVQDGGKLDGHCRMEHAHDPKQRPRPEADPAQLPVNEPNGKEAKEKARQAG
ncbi:bactofilin family protein [Paenibacillus arenilitoris]|uniref:Polymer-forming cytoskeletal protein n=1 Tax=Paenibacillus arenilitoris TaxID=2772299 RepID=A0A927CI56_9BACL|nr:polymer-forming cytoskeletal protein [Paenibacillus arenilitoris]MBD2867954.1 polymer-forming cytoskeletal protein [Paenibacillus arenilitoris]